MTLVDSRTGEVVDLSSIEACELVIARGLETFVEVGEALMQIRENRWHRDAGYRNFDEYCRERWGISRTYSTRLIAAAETMAELTDQNKVVPIGTTSEGDEVVPMDTTEIGPQGPLPTAESQVRPLTGLPTPDAKREAWDVAVGTAETEGRKPTAKDVEAAVDRIRADKRAEQAAEDARLDEELERRGIRKATPEEAAATKKAARALGSIRLTTGRILETVDGMTPVEFIDAYRHVGIYRVHNLPVDDIEHVGRWLTELAGGIRRESQ